MELLIISSCTKRKAANPPNKLTLNDFRDHARLKAREAELAAWSRPALEMYRGQQHLDLVTGLDILRRGALQSVASLKIISAGYGLIDENRVICPYDATFKGMDNQALRAWARHLNIPEDVRCATDKAPLVLFLLGDEYLQSIAPPIKPALGQRFIFLVKPSLAPAVSCTGVSVVEAGQQQGEILRYKRMAALKGHMFHLFCKGLVRSPDSAFENLRADNSPKTFMGLVAKGAS